MTAAIICNGDFPKKPYPRYMIEQCDVVICCDGGLRAWLRAYPDRLPDKIVGDMDSLSGALRKRFADRVVHYDEQDYNDQTKAVRYIMENLPDVDRIHIFAATGKREDHTIGNISLLMEYARMFPGRAEIDMISDHSTMSAVTDTVTLAVGEGRTVSILSPDNSLKITSSGLEWQTSGVVFDNWWKATLNRATSDMVTLTFNHPSLALVILP